MELLEELVHRVEKLEERQCNMEDQIVKNQEAIRANLHDIRTSVDKLQYIEIRNGGNREVTFKRKDFYQMLYDRPKEAFNKLAENSSKLNKIIDLVFKVSVIVVSVTALIFTLKGN